MRLTLPVYPVLPAMRCDKGCGRCCGPATCSKAELEAIKSYAAAHSVVPQRNGLTCPFFQEGVCSVYPVRPYVCRMMGHSTKLRCDLGYNVNIPRHREAKLMSKYLRNHRPNFLLHGLIYSDEEMTALIDPEELAATEREMRGC